MAIPLRPFGPRSATIVIILEILPIIGMLLSVPALALIRSRDPPNLLGTKVLGSAGVTFIGVDLVFHHLIVAIAAVVSRFRDKGPDRRYCMPPIWPAMVLIGLAGSIIVLTQQTLGAILAMVAILVAD